MNKTSADHFNLIGHLLKNFGFIFIKALDKDASFIVICIKSIPNNDESNALCSASAFSLSCSIHSM